MKNLRHWNVPDLYDVILGACRVQWVNAQQRWRAGGVDGGENDQLNNDCASVLVVCARHGPTQAKATESAVQ